MSRIFFALFPIGLVGLISYFFETVLAGPFVQWFLLGVFLVIFFTNALGPWILARRFYARKVSLPMVAEVLGRKKGKFYCFDHSEPVVAVGWFLFSGPMLVFSQGAVLRFTEAQWRALTPLINYRIRRRFALWVTSQFVVLYACFFSDSTGSWKRLFWIRQWFGFPLLWSMANFIKLERWQRVHGTEGQLGRSFQSYWTADFLLTAISLNRKLG